MRKHRLSKRVSRKQFARTATAIRKRNKRVRPMRGGFRI